VSIDPLDHYPPEYVARLRTERDAWIRLFNRLEGAVTHHRKAYDMDQAALPESPDEALWAAHDRVVRDAATMGE
jgi:hypothetical protein